MLHHFQDIEVFVEGSFLAAPCSSDVYRVNCVMTTVSDCSSLHSCHILQMYLNRRLCNCVLWKFKMADTATLDFVINKM